MMFLLYALLSFSQAAELKISQPSYESAEKAASYFKFTGHSRKLGIIGTSFEGYAKEATLSFERKGDKLQGIRLAIPAAKIDTDNDSRNEKMWDVCLSAKDFPEVKIHVKDPVDTKKDSQAVAAEMEVRGKAVPLEIRVEKSGALFKGSSAFKLSEAGIPDPSIAIASVKDEFELEFQVDIAEAK